MDAILRERVRIVLSKIELALGLDAATKEIKHTPNIDRAHRVLDDFHLELTDDDEETPLELLGLHYSTCGLLYSAGITSVEMLRQLTDEQLVQIDQIRAGRVKEIREALSRAGL